MTKYLCVATQLLKPSSSVSCTSLSVDSAPKQRWLRLISLGWFVRGHGPEQRHQPGKGTLLQYALRHVYAANHGDRLAWSMEVATATPPEVLVAYQLAQPHCRLERVLGVIDLDAGNACCQHRRQHGIEI